MPKKTSKKAGRSPKERSNVSAAKPMAARSSKKKAPARSARASGKKPKARRVEAIPAAYGVVTPQLVVSPCTDALAFYEKAFGAKVTMKMPGPNGALMHAEMKIGGAIIMLSDELPPMSGQGPRKTPKSVGATTGGVMLYVKDVDAVFARAVEAGAKGTMPPQDTFWGDRFGQVEDPFGHAWSMATHIRDVSPKEMRAAMASMTPAEA
jgi:PhnB protein